MIKERSRYRLSCQYFFLPGLKIVWVALLLNGCATMIRGTTQDVSVNTTPTGACVQFSNGTSALTPCTVAAERKSPLQLTITKEGYQTHTSTLVPSLAGAGAVLGGLIDYGTGAVYDLQPNPYHVTLIPISGDK